MNDLNSALGEDVSLALPSFHAFTGCDYNPAFFKKGKTKPFNALRKNKEFIEAFKSISNLPNEIPDNIVTTIEKFVCTIYGFKTLQNVNDGRVASFLKVYKIGKDNSEFKLTEKNFDASLLPPSKSELVQQILRSAYISNIWNNAYKQVPTTLNYLDYGWQLEENKLICKWFDGDQLPPTVENITRDVENTEGIY